MTAARHFIDERLDGVWKDVYAYFKLWHTGKKFPGIEFSGSIVLRFWEKSLDQYAGDFTNTAFAAAREIANEHNFDEVETVIAASGAAENAIHRVVANMIRIDQSKRGKGFPGSVEPRDATWELDRCIGRLHKRTEAEVEAARSRGKRLVTLPLSSDHGMLWFWAHADYRVRFGVLSAAVTLSLSAATAGYFANQNDFFRRAFDLFRAADSITPPMAQPTQPPTTAPAAQIPQNTTTAPTTIQTIKSD